LAKVVVGIEDGGLSAEVTAFGATAGASGREDGDVAGERGGGFRCVWHAAKLAIHPKAHAR
jgi:hypothetical protein